MSDTVWTDLLARPALYEDGGESIWRDEHISKGMLEAHLDPERDAASRKISFIEESVKWINTIVPPHTFRELLDLGCGPGLYAERFCRLGYDVTGMDFSERSVKYAREQASCNGSSIKYCVENYLEMTYTERFDVVTMIYCDYAVLSRNDRLRLLKLVRQALKPNGRFIFDVFTEGQRAEESRSWYYSNNSDFWSAEPHLCLEAVYQYSDGDKTELQRTVVCTKGSVRCFNVWNHYFTAASLLDETAAVGFSATEIYGDVAGARYKESSETICCVLTK